MRIIQITPGSGDQFYCENCLRDLSLVRAMHRAGHETLMVPLYLPLNLDAAPPATQAPLFFGGVNVYLQQKMGLFRKTPRWLDRWLDSPRLLGRIAKLSGMTSANELGETTVSMLKGPDGRQLKELNRLIDWLKTQPRPEVIVLSNILLAGMAPMLKKALGVPLVCLLQDEEGFLDALPGPYAKEAWRLVRQNASAFDGLIAVSGYYRRVMAERLGIALDRVVFIPMGLDPATFTVSAEAPAVPTIGFLSRMGHDYGLDIVARAAVLLRKDARLKNLKLRITGGKTSRDEAFLSGIRDSLLLEMGPDAEFREGYDLESRKAFLNGISVVAVPVRKPQAYGLFALEACAAGVPFAVPPVGVFPELAEVTSARILYEPNTPECLADVLKQHLLDKNGIFEMGRRGREAIEGFYSIDRTVEKMTELFGTLRTI
jgi:glycosyltransferase involved in cell wall biosynthesis